MGDYMAERDSIIQENKTSDYQRIYCWEEKNITALWNNLKKMPEDQDYHLGSIILQNMENGYHIIDGQQRLVTLTLCLRALGYEGNMPLLAQRFESKEACENIANAKYYDQRWLPDSCGCDSRYRA